MLSYPYINTLFKNILAKSKAIEGRFHIMPLQGSEINSDEYNESLADIIEQGTKKTTPFAALLPPRSNGSYTGQFGEWEAYRFVMVFLKASFISSANQTVNRNPNTNTSRHTIPEDWHDMKRAANGFIKMLADVIKYKGLENRVFRLTPGERYLEPISLVGKKLLSGVKLEFSGSLYINCEEVLEDYEFNALNTIVLPNGDQHPIHKL